MKSIIKVVVSVFLTSATTIGFGCDYPVKANVPDGFSATKDDMLSGQRTVKQYVADMEAYLECIVAEEKEWRGTQETAVEPEDEQLREDMLNKKYNAAVQEMELVAAEFNAAVQTYKERDD